MTSSGFDASPLKYVGCADTPRVNPEEDEDEDDVEEDEDELEALLETETLGGILSQLYNSHLPSSLKIPFLLNNARVISSNPLCWINFILT